MSTKQVLLHKTRYKAKTNDPNNKQIERLSRSNSTTHQRFSKLEKKYKKSKTFVDKSGDNVPDTVKHKLQMKAQKMQIILNQ